MRVDLPISEAENLIATIWIALETHGLTSPKMTILSRSTKLQIEFLFESGRDEDLVKAELPPAVVRPEPVRRSSGRQQSRARAMLKMRKRRRIVRRLAG